MQYDSFEYGRPWGRRFGVQRKDQATRCAGEPYPHQSVEIPARDLDGREVLLKENVIFGSNGVSAHTLLWKTDGTWLGNQ